MFCELDHGEHQGLAPKCVISRIPMGELSQTGAGFNTGGNRPPASHSFSATWNAGPEGRRRLPSCLHQRLELDVETSATRRFVGRLACWLVLVATLAVPAMAKQHPVPLDAKTDAAKCIECHADKAKGKAVHSAIATGCLSCHEVRSTKDVTRIKLITTTSCLLYTSDAAETPYL